MIRVKPPPYVPPERLAVRIKDGVYRAGLYRCPAGDIKRRHNAFLDGAETKRLFRLNVSPSSPPALFETGALLPAERIRTEESFFFKKVFRPHQLTLLVYFCLELGSGAARAHGQHF